MLYLLFKLEVGSAWFGYGFVKTVVSRVHS